MSFGQSRVAQGIAKQRGISFIGLLLVGIIVACVFIVAAQVAPTVIEWQAIQKATKKAAEGTTVPEVRAIFERAQAIDDFTSVRGKDLVVEKINDKVVVSYAYDKEIHLFGPAYLLLKYKGSSS